MQPLQNPLLCMRVPPPSFGSKGGGDTLLAGEGAQLDEETDTDIVKSLYVCWYCQLSKQNQLIHLVHQI
jgi:hypothetical protein